MKLIYITSYTFPSRRAEPYYLKSMAEAFVELLGKDFSFVIRGDVTLELKNTNAVSVQSPERFKSLWYFFWFPRFVRKQKLHTEETVFMSNDPYLLVIFVFWKKVARMKYRICSDWHQLLDDWKDNFISRNSDYLITTSERLKGFLMSVCSVESKKILVAYGGINLRLFEEKRDIKQSRLREQLGLPRDLFLVGYIGGFRSVGLEKGLGTMVRALENLPEDVRMVFVGGTKKDIEEYEVLAKSLHVHERCIFIGKQQFEKVIEYELSMDVLAIPYPDKHHFRDYGFPMKVWEYMASGRPIVYSNLAIIGEALTGRGTSCIPDDPRSFAGAIATIREDRKKADEVGRKNIHIVQKYTWNARVTRIVDFIE